MADALERHDKRVSREGAALRLPPGLAFASEIMTPEYETEIIAYIESLDLSSFHLDVPGQRYSVAFGWRYHPQTGDMVPGDSLPDELLPLQHVAAEFAGVDPDELAQCILTRYQPGAIIPWHFHEPQWRSVIGISLGSSSPMVFRRHRDGDKAQPVELHLPPRSMYLLSGEARDRYQHRIPPVEKVRWSVTFRDLSEEGRQITSSRRG